MGPKWGRQAPGGPMLAPWSLLSGLFPLVVCNRALTIAVGFESITKMAYFVMLHFIELKRMKILQIRSINGNKIHHFEENNLGGREDIVKLKAFGVVKTWFQCLIMKIITPLRKKKRTISEIVCGPLLCVYKFKETWIQNMHRYECVHSIYVHCKHIVYPCFVKLKRILTLNV